MQGHVQFQDVSVKPICKKKPGSASSGLGFRFQGLGFRLLGLGSGFRVSDVESIFLWLHVHFPRVLVSGFRFWVYVFPGSGFGFRDSGFVFRVSSSGFGFQGARNL